MKRLLLLISAGAGFGILIAVASFLVLGPFDPNKEVKRMLISMANVQTMAYRSGASMTADAAGNRETTTVYAYGTVRLSDPARVDHQSVFRMIRVHRGSEDYVDRSGEWRSFPSADFLRYDPSVRSDWLTDLAGAVWLRFAPGDAPRISAMLGGVFGPEGLVFPEGRRWNEDSLPRLRALLARAAIVTADFDGITELIGTKNTRPINAQFDPAATRAFLSEIIRVREDRDLNEAECAWIERSVATLEPIRLRMWIGVEDHLLYRLQAAGVTPIEDGRIAMDLRLDLSEFNETFAASVPSDAVASSALKLKYVSLPASASASGESTQAAEADFGSFPTSFAENTDPDHDGLDNVLERFYGTNANDADTDDDGSSDGEEVLSGRNPSGGGSLFGFGLGQKRS